MSGKTAVVTGANSGIGLSVSRALAAAGARVVFAVRDVERGTLAAAGVAGRTEVRELDLGNLDSVRAFARAWNGPIELMINNAGVSEPSVQRTADGFEAMFGINHLGHFTLTNLLLEHVTGRVVTVASMAERMGRLDFNDLTWRQRTFRPTRAYGDSKLANLLFTAELQRRLTAVGSGVLANAAHPGLVSTKIYDNQHSAALKLAVRALGQGADRGALPVLFAALADIPGNSFAGPKHLFHMRGAPELITRSAAARDPQLARRLWTHSEDLTGIVCPI